MSWFPESKKKEEPQKTEETESERVGEKPKKKSLIHKLREGYHGKIVPEETKPSKKGNKKVILSITILAFILIVLVSTFSGSFYQVHTVTSTVMTTVNNTTTTTVQATITTYTIQATKIIYVTTNSTSASH
jgi:hypothetical protein